jgi:hypothetical protein
MSLVQYYRSFLRTPYENANFMYGSGNQTGGLNNRFGGPLSGNPNPNVLFGSPTGGYNEGAIRNRNQELISGPYQNTITGSGKSKKSSDPRYWGTAGQLYNKSQMGNGPLINNYINPDTLHKTRPLLGSFVF